MPPRALLLATPKSWVAYRTEGLAASAHKMPFPLPLPPLSEGGLLVAAEEERRAGV